MSDHLNSGVDQKIAPENSQQTQDAEILPTSGECSSTHPVADRTSLNDKEQLGEHDLCDENEPLIQTVECRICQEEDSLVNLETPCACSGSLKYAHRKCVQRWCNEKGDVICEICCKPYQHGYTAPPPAPQLEDTAIDIGEGWTLAGTPLDLQDPRILAMAAAERHLLEAEYDEYGDGSANGASFCRTAALILMALLLLKHTMSLSNSDGDDDAATFFSLFMLRAAVFLLPCYIMAWAISILQRRRERQEAAAALAAAEVAFMIQAGQHGGLHFAVAPGPVVTPQAAVVQPQLPV
ncbi:Probable E3 ubiquitin ligase SUD1 [Linum perenne]